MKGASDEDKKAALESLVENYEDENLKVGGFLPGIERSPQDS